MLSACGDACRAVARVFQLVDQRLFPDLVPSGLDGKTGGDSRSEAGNNPRWFQLDRRAGNLSILVNVLLIVGLVAAPIAVSGDLGASSSGINDPRQAKLSLREAVSAAQRARDGKALWARYKVSAGTASYEILVASYGAFDVMTVDAHSGRAKLKQPASGGRSETAAAGAIEQSGISLAQAIATAESQGGTALDAEIDTKRGKLSYKIDLADGDDTPTVWVAVDSGHIIQKS